MDEILDSIDFLQSLFNAEVDGEDMFEFVEGFSSNTLVFHRGDGISFSVEVLSPKDGYLDTGKKVKVWRDFYLYDGESGSLLAYINGSSVKNGVFTLESDISVLPYCIGNFKELSDEIDRLSKYAVK